MSSKKINRMKTNELMATLARFKKNKDFNSKYYQEVKTEYNRRLYHKKEGR